MYVTRLAPRQVAPEPHLTETEAAVLRHSRPEAPITGMALLYPVCSVHLLEGRTTALYGVLADLASDKGRAGAQIADTRVVAFTEDAPARFFASWSAAFVHEKSPKETADPADAAAAVKGISDLLSVLRRVGKAHAHMSAHAVAEQLAAMEAHFLDLPGPEEVLALAGTEEAPSAAEFLAVYDSSVSADLDSERAWPAPLLRL